MFPWKRQFRRHSRDPLTRRLIRISTESEQNGIVFINEKENIMKKLLSLILAGLILSSGMIACSDKTAKETESSSSDASTETESETLNDEFIFSTTGKSQE